MTRSWSVLLCGGEKILAPHNLHSTFKVARDQKSPAKVFFAAAEGKPSHGAYAGVAGAEGSALARSDDFRRAPGTFSASPSLNHAKSNIARRLALLGAITNCASACSSHDSPDPHDPTAGTSGQAGAASSAAGSQLWGRMMVYFEGVPDGHTDLARGNGGPNYDVGEQHDSIMLNYYAGSAATDCWARSTPRSWTAPSTPTGLMQLPGQ